MKSITIETLATHLVAAFLPVVMEERATGKRILNVMDGASKAHRREVEAEVDQIAAIHPEAVAESLVQYLVSVAWQFDENHRDAADWVATALCDAAIAATYAAGWKSPECESVTATLALYPTATESEG